MNTITRTLAFTVVLGLICCLTSGCSKPKKKDGKTQPPADGQVIHKAPGQVQNSGCKDLLNDVFFISRATLPGGMANESSAAPGNFPEARVGFIVGKANTILQTTDGGTTWRPVLKQKPDGPNFERVLFMSTNEGWAVSMNALLHTSDCGKTWEPAAKLPEKFYYFGPASATTSAYYQMQPPTCGAAIWETRNGGTTWTALPANLPHNDYSTVFFFDNMNGWVAGNYGRCARTTDAGRTWQEQTLASGGYLSQIQFVSPLIGWMRPLQGHNGRISTSRDGGFSWQTQNIGIKTYWNILDMQFLDERIGFLLIHAGVKNSQLLRTLDGSATWNLIGTHQADLTAICFVSANEGWVVGSDGCVFHYRL